MTRPHHGVHPHRRHLRESGRHPRPGSLTRRQQVLLQRNSTSPASVSAMPPPQPAVHRKQELQLSERHLGLVSVRGRSDWLCGTGLRVRSLNGHGEAVGDRRSVVEADRVAAASPSARHARPCPTQRPEVFAGHPVRALHRYQLEAPATRARLRIRCHLLAAIPPLVRGRSLGPPSPNAALGAARARRDRLVRGLSRRLPCQGQKGGRRNGSVTGRPRPSRLQTPHRLRLGRHPLPPAEPGCAAVTRRPARGRARERTGSATALRESAMTDSNPRSSIRWATASAAFESSLATARATRYDYSFSVASGVR
jgi:hypothetical protein